MPPERSTLPLDLLETRRGLRRAVRLRGEEA
jgi:hypothetical protein